ncbi:beta strand repeat-containing protein [Hoeflea ulvae]|uniref:Curlin associated repeat-containing protein n=1 Tax=Hoeflea ulvae TaxID=2983764 RepID=A0ABT3YE63_9HYPH|nr:hypothetical protein [Hoeflea ulvae]MCY0094035.1 hypothetical protein [Hoeflea ulvae]
MKLKTTLLSATAMALLIGAAYAADNNKAYLDQTGSDNTALIEQTGDNNQAGKNGPWTVLIQNGTFNDLDINQAGDGNKAGIRNGGIDQHGPRNTLSISQPGNSNEVVTIGQFGRGSSGFVSNQASISQRSNNNFVGNVAQDNNSAMTSANLLNQLSVIQRAGDDNTITEIDQDGGDNRLAIRQVGGNNEIGKAQQGAFNNVFNSTRGRLSIHQTGDDNVVTEAKQAGERNTAHLTFTGDRNGNGGFTPLSNGFAGSVAGGFSSSLIQSGTNNSATLNMTGDDNQFGINQNGIDNSVGSLSFTGDGNELGVDQTGNDNMLGLSDIFGDDNDIGVKQVGDSNTASVNTNASGSSNSNAVHVDQTSAALSAGNDAFVLLNGNSNVIDILQNGLNEADVSANGNGNYVNIDQLGTSTANVHIGTAGPNTSSDNDIFVKQDGDNLANVETHAGNTNYLNVDQQGGSAGQNQVSVFMWSSFSNRGGFSGDAGGVATTAGLTAGDIFQDGSLNTVELGVGDVSYSLDNQFAFNQNGTGNMIDGSINGNNNQAVIAQLGNGNNTTFTQTGNGNNLGVSQ